MSVDYNTQDEIQEVDEYNTLDDNYVFGESYSKSQEEENYHQQNDNEYSYNDNTDEELKDVYQKEMNESSGQTNTEPLSTDEKAIINPISLFDADDSLYSKEFSSIEEKVKYYEDIIRHNAKLVKEELPKIYLEKYEEELIKKEQDLDTLLEIKEAMKSENPSQFLRKYFGEHLGKLGYNLKYSNDEIESIIDEKMKEKYGQNYMDEYDPMQLVSPTSKTSQIYREKEKLYNALQEENEKYSNTTNTPQAPNPEEYQKLVEKEYQEFEKFGMPKKEYEEFLPKGIETLSNMKLVDVWKVVNFDNIVNQARINAKKEVYDEIKKAGGKSVKEDYREDYKENNQRNEIKSIADYWNSRSNKPKEYLL
jgi:hypothetical protein